MHVKPHNTEDRDHIFHFNGVSTQEYSLFLYMHYQHVSKKFILIKFLLATCCTELKPEIL